jgi:chemotaxis protein methyltransferase WspC
MPLSRIQELLENTVGLDLASLGNRALERAVRERARQLNSPNREQYWRLLRSSVEEQLELVECLMVPETWFFRDAAAFTTMADWIKQVWLPRHSEDRLRLLSAACSTGEEPYSMAIALLRAGIPPERFEVEAWDISHQALAKAERAHYGRNSFRSHSPAALDPYLKSELNGYSVVPSVRNQVRFRQTNLLSPKHAASVPVYAVVFCRNVLIYLTARAREKALTHLSSILCPEGLLFVGPAETSLARQQDFRPWTSLKTFAFHRSIDALGDRRIRMETVRNTTPAKAISDRVSLTARGRKDGRVSVSRPSDPGNKSVSAISAGKASGQGRIPAITGAGEPSLADAESLANDGRLQEAARLCESLLKAGPPQAANYHLLGLIQEALDRKDSAEDCHRKAIFLDPHHSGALQHLALLTEQKGDILAARRLRHRAQRAYARGEHKTVL